MLAGGELVPLAVIGIWNREAPDRTALAALRAGQPMRALELAEGGPHDSDIAAPITDATGEVRGVVAARGVPGGGASMAALRDLSVIADWASLAICDAGRSRASRPATASPPKPRPPKVSRRCRSRMQTNNEESANPKPR